MKLKIRYENRFQVLELNEDEKKQLCQSLSIPVEESTENEIQRAFDEMFNKPERNNHQKETRHIDPNPHVRTLNGKRVSTDNSENEYRQFSTEMLPDSNAKMPDFEYEDLCRYIRSVLKPSQAELFISVYFDDVPVSVIASKEDVSSQAVSHRLATAKKNLKIFLKNPHI